MTVNGGQFQNDKILKKRTLNSRMHQARLQRSPGNGVNRARFGQTIQRRCKCGQHTIGGGSCAACRQHRDESLPVIGGNAAQSSHSQRKPDAAVPVDGTTGAKAVDFSRIPASAKETRAQPSIARPLLASTGVIDLIEREADPALIMRKAPHGQSCESVPFGESEEEEQNSVMTKPDIDHLQRKSEAAGPTLTAINPIRISARPIQSDALIQAYSLKGFPEDKKSKMDAAISAAISKTQSCEKLSWWGKSQIPKALGRLKYIYKPDLGLCGWTFPASWYIKVGKSAFDKSTCCDLESTLAHEASHTQFYTEGKARKMECNCFGCSC